jgi:hypothetical protein
VIGGQYSTGGDIDDRRVTSKIVSADASSNSSGRCSRKRTESSASWWNYECLHSELDYIPPVEFEDWDLYTLALAPP